MLPLCPFRSFKRLDSICTAWTKTFNIIFYSENHFCMNYTFNYFNQHVSCSLDQHRTKLKVFYQKQHQVSCKVKGLKMTPCWTYHLQDVFHPMFASFLPFPGHIIFFLNANPSISTLGCSVTFPAQGEGRKFYHPALMVLLSSVSHK